MKMQHKMNKLLLGVLLTTSLLSGCQVVSVKNQALNVSIANERDSILSRSKLSEATLNVLSMSGREAKSCTDTPEQCIDEIKKIPQIQDEQIFSAASELYLAKAIALGDSSACKPSVLSSARSEEKQAIEKQNLHNCVLEQMNMLDRSIRYSYAYMFKTQRAPQDRIFDNRQVQIRDFYNQGIAKLVGLYTTYHAQAEAVTQIQVGKSRYRIDYSHYDGLKNSNIEQLMSTYNLNFSGLRSITRRDGFGAEFLFVLPEDKQPDGKKSKYIINPMDYKYPNNINPNINNARYLAATLTAEPLNNQSIDDILNNPDFLIKVYDPYKYETLKIASKSYPLAANFSAPYGLWLAENNLGKAAYLSLIDRDENITMPHLYMLEPYNPDKKVIVLVHGLASSPEAWIRLTNDIMGDNVLREHYQVWQVFYSTNMPIIESRFQIYALLTQAFARVDAKNTAKKDAVLIGHSMGGIIARLLVSDADISNQALKMMNSRQLQQYQNIPVVKQRMVMNDVPNFSRAIFLASPHRGTDYADRWFTKVARKVIKLPGAFLSAFADVLTQEEDLKDLLKQVDQGLIQNGPSDLSHKSNFMQLTEDIKPRAGLKYHSIIGNISGSDDPALITDGVVPYKSAHLDGAVSEVILKGGHSIQETPEAVLELRRILRLHLAELGLYKPK
ncbi:alpha/beta fold hydrolase [Acinetobacter chengduensis]|uniref:Alpha/beta fold hydrolase n=2 Tax=Moraxellaceae TaxID=468 RepID=A0ABX9U016_9GAMM|nr:MULTISPECIES: alpha/beta hydrolase [Acinetobacter]MBI1450454.1 alpha/beta hydrolase [Acinetobacter sp. FL51]RKG44834.1 alpha/beta hydrolase [Acinetobacter sp. WCHAc060007]RLL23599.1 alpha/beta fold hydrolase [Acinetobacter chengduensis]